MLSELTRFVGAEEGLGALDPVLSERTRLVGAEDGLGGAEDSPLALCTCGGAAFGCRGGIQSALEGPTKRPADAGRWCVRGGDGGGGAVGAD